MSRQNEAVKEIFLKVVFRLPVLLFYSFNFEKISIVISRAFLLMLSKMRNRFLNKNWRFTFHYLTAASASHFHWFNISAYRPIRDGQGIHQANGARCKFYYSDAGNAMVVIVMLQPMAEWPVCRKKQVSDFYEDAEWSREDGTDKDPYSPPPLVSCNNLHNQ